APAGRRWALGSGLAGLGLLGLGGAFLAGLRLGRGERQVALAGAAQATGPGAAPADEAMALVERFHAHSAQSRRAAFTGFPAVDWGAAPPAFKRHPGAPRLALAPVAADAPGARNAPGALAALGAALWLTAGVTERRGGLALRASPSSGALFSTELYVAATALPGLAPGLWHYDAEGHALVRLRDGAPDAAELGLPAAPGAAPAARVIATAVFRRTGRKYRDRAYRYVLADLGHALENLRVAATALGFDAHLVAAFDGPRLAATLGLDEDEEGVLALMEFSLARPGTLPRQGGASCPVPGSESLSPPPLPRALPPLGVTGAVHRATSLRAGTVSGEDMALPGPAPAAVAASAPRQARAVVLPAIAPSASSDVLRRIATRRSVRRFAPTPVPLPALAGVLAALAQPPLLSAAIRVDVVAHAVAGLDPGVWRMGADGRVLHPRRVPLAPAALRAAARAAALDQDVIGDAAAVLVLSADRAVLARDGCGAARGYRHAFLEAGLVGERVYLEAAARGLGACAVGAFYDDEAEALLGVDPAREWVLHFAALGVPAGG
ncbi:SagB/ThcOx family dehydrogenase, partial [Azohydromonas aeria]|uniref:SagB/ThcOx family dehydrogenase n=1 Tax=Azohydromonas aeria TaxID=2590212 RepID=UPI0012F83572